MPVIIVRRPESARWRGGRGGYFDRQAAALAPQILSFQSAGIRDIRKLADALNNAGISAPSGRPFSFSTTRRILLRLQELKLAAGPRTLASAASHRPSRQYKFRPGRNMRLTNSQRQEIRRTMASDVME